jgi:ABC-type bacteriocin/lantibiotic exporter with double-glycine peptidase domain
MMLYVYHEGISNVLATVTVTAFLSFRLRMRMNHKIDCEVCNQWETELIARFVLLRNQWVTKLIVRRIVFRVGETESIARFVTNRKQN